MKRIKRSLTNFGRHMLFRVRVNGESCWPVLVPGRSYWATALGRIRKGDFVVLKSPIGKKQILVKKIFGVQDGAYEVGSTVSWGLSSQDFGAVDKQHILGKVIRWNTK